MLFSFFFLPQIFFYGVRSLAGAILNGISAVTASGTVASLATVIIGGAGGLVAYVLAARWLKIGELSDLTAMLRARLPGWAGWQAR